MPATKKTPAKASEKVQAETQLFERIHAQLGRLDSARKRVGREQAVLDQLVAEAVSAKPEIPTWYMHPGTLSLDQACGAASLTERGLALLMRRYHERYRTTPKRRRSARKG